MIGSERSYCESLIVFARRISLMLAVIFIAIWNGDRRYLILQLQIHRGFCGTGAADTRLRWVRST